MTNIELSYFNHLFTSIRMDFETIKNVSLKKVKMPDFEYNQVLERLKMNTRILNSIIDNN